MPNPKSKKKIIARTVKIKIDPSKEQFLSLMDMASKVYNKHVDWCFKHKSTNTKKVHKNLYSVISKQFPTFPVALIQSVRDSALGNIKTNNQKKKWKFKSTKSSTSAVSFDLRTSRLVIKNNEYILKLSTLEKSKRYSTVINFPKHSQYLLTEKLMEKINGSSREYN
jgi:hypothetical protein